MFNFYEFFAGGGMVRAGLGDQWKCLFANDLDKKKAASYISNWGASDLTVKDVNKLGIDDLPENPDLAWASFPCQDLSLAGAGAGLQGSRSGTFWPFWNLMLDLNQDGRAPSLIVLENVCGALTSHGGNDFAAISDAIASSGYKFGAIILDASSFVPQSRPRLFIVAVHNDVPIDPSLIAPAPTEPFHPKALITAFEKLSDTTKQNWVWWGLPNPVVKNETLADLIEETPSSTNWHSQEETQKLLAQMSDLNRKKVEAAKKVGTRKVGAIYKRTRISSEGRKVQRAEVRFDNLAGCLRTPAGGSSRQLIMVVEDRKIRSRLLSSRETARLMGLPDDYILPDNYNEAYHLTGDGVVVPVVRFLAEKIFEPILSPRRSNNRKAA